MTTFRVRDVHIYRPYRDEVPWDLLAESGADEDLLADVQAQNLLRVAKYQGRVVGAYGIRPLTPLRFELVTLIVADGYRRKGLGRWLLGHAIGLAETKGAREVIAAGASRGAARAGRFLSRMGFEADAAGDFRLVLTPE